MPRFPMTPAGKTRMKAELDRLKSVERNAIVRAIEEARAHGDLRENAEYHAAKEKQGMIEARIRDYEAKLSNAEVIDPAALSGDRVSFGATVTLLDTDTDEKVTYSIVGEDEADFKAGLISLQAPIARAILGKHEGDEATAETGAGRRSFEILKVIFREIPLPPRPE